MILSQLGANGHLGANCCAGCSTRAPRSRVLLPAPDSDNSSVDGLSVERVFGDLPDPASLVAATRASLAIYHCAAQISTRSGGEQQIFANNVLGTRNLLRAALAERR